MKAHPQHTIFDSDVKRFLVTTHIYCRVRLGVKKKKNKRLVI